MECSQHSVIVPCPGLFSQLLATSHPPKQRNNLPVTNCSSKCPGPQVMMLEGWHSHLLSSWEISTMRIISIILKTSNYPSLALYSAIYIYTSEGLFNISTWILTSIFFLPPLVAFISFVQHSFTDLCSDKKPYPS